MAPKVVLITGVADYWGWRLAERLAAEPEIALIGIGAAPPESHLAELDFILADVANPALAALFRSEQVHTVCHLEFVHRARPSTAVSELNVEGTQKVLEACAEAGVRQVVLKSSLAVYGAHPNNDSMLTETHSLRGSRRYGYTRNLLDIESRCQSFRREVPELALTVLRFANIVGPTADTPMTRLLKNPCSPIPMGFDPMLQVIHEDDVIEALALAVLRDRAGTFNVAADGPMPLSQIMALAGTVPLPVLHPLAYWGVEILSRSRMRVDRYVPIELDYLRYSWVGDVTKMYQELGFEPIYTAEQTLREFARQQKAGPYKTRRTALALDEGRLQAVIERRCRIREQPMPTSAKGEKDG